LLAISLCSRFSALTGEGPIVYLTRWRIQLAARLLIEYPNVRINEIAEWVGYHSEAAFSKAFKRAIGVAPSKYRR
jgi:AraC-like DNA-binding protein